MSEFTACNPRWLAPELLLHGASSFAVDIYAAGILIWEMCDGGRAQCPYEGLFDHDVDALILNGELPEFPDDASPILRHIAAKCLQFKAVDRPTANIVQGYLKMCQ